MIFGKINYINLAPFHIFLKKYIKNNAFKSSIQYHSSYPSDINNKFKKRKIDAAFISSVESFGGNFKRHDIGIIANKEVRSVIVKKGKPKEDFESASSNALAKVLKIQGEIIIGDKALKLYLKSPEEFVDLCSLWHQKTKLPFVFARFCSNKHHKFYEKLLKNFIKKKHKIPYYILKKYEKKTNINTKQIKEYLKLINYQIDQKSKKSLKKFQKLYSSL